MLRLGASRGKAASFPGACADRGQPPARCWTPCPAPAGLPPPSGPLTAAGPSNVLTRMTPSAPKHDSDPPQASWAGSRQHSQHLSRGELPDQPGTAGSHQNPTEPSLLPRAPQASGTHRGRDPPAPHARDLEAAFLDLLARQPHLEVELVVASADNDVASLLREVSDAGVELEIAVVLQGLRQADELRAEPGKLSTDGRPPATPPGPGTGNELSTTRSCRSSASPVLGLLQSQHRALPYLLLGDFFLQGLQLPVLFLVDKDPSMLDVRHRLPRSRGW